MSPIGAPKSAYCHLHTINYNSEKCPLCPKPKLEAVNHPPHYGKADDPYEVIKVLEAWKLGFHLGNTVKYIARAELKNSPIEDLEKARWYLDREITNRKAKL